MAREKRPRNSRPRDKELPPRIDPFGSLPNICACAIFENFTAVELIGLRRVSRGWKDAIDWWLASFVRKHRPELAKGVDEEQALLEFRRDAFRQKARSDGRAEFIKTFTHAEQGFAVCGDYFCWIDDTCLNIQLVFTKNWPRRHPPVKWYRLTKLLRSYSLSVTVIKSQEVGSMTDRPLLMIKHSRKRREQEPIHTRIAMICVKSGRVLWSKTHDEHPRPAPWGKLVTLNNTTIAYIAQLRPGQDLLLYVRDILTGEIKATKPIPSDLLPFLVNEQISFQLHPRRDILYIGTCRKAFFLSTATANHVGRLDVPRVSVAHSQVHPSEGPLRFCFSERQPIYSPPAREKFFLYQYSSRASNHTCYSFEYEIPTDEEISTSEGKILQGGDKRGWEPNLVSKALRIQIYDNYFGMSGLLELNPMLKQITHTEYNYLGLVPPDVKLRSFKKPCQLSNGIYDIYQGKKKLYNDSSIPIEFYSQPRLSLLIVKTMMPGGGGRDSRENEMAITLTERYVVFKDQSTVYLSAFEPRW